jgi:hypothetical protein
LIAGTPESGELNADQVLSIEPDFIIFPAWLPDYSTPKVINHFVSALNVFIFK